MATVSNPNAGVMAGNGLGPKTHVLTVDDVSAVSVATAVAEAQVEGFVVAAIEDAVATDGCHIVLQGTGTPAIGGCTLVVTFEDALGRHDA